MSASVDQEASKSAVPIADLTALDRALRGNGAPLEEVLKTYRPADIGRDFARRTVSICQKILAASDARRAAAMLHATHASIAARAVQDLDPKHAAAILKLLTTDHRVALLAELAESDRKEIESALTDEERGEIDRHLALPEGSVGRMAMVECWTIQRGATVAAALEVLRAGHDRINVATNCYVLDADRTLVGVVALRDMALAGAETAIESIMVKDVIALRQDASRADAAEILQTHEFLSLPIVDDKRRFVGAVRVDDVLDTALDRLGIAALNQGAVQGDQAARLPYFQLPITKVVRSRITWLILLFVAETATGTVLRHFEDTLSRVVALSFFIPLLIGTGGNAGSQTVSTVIRALSLGEVRVSDVLRVVTKEVTTGLLLGVLLGVIAFFRARLWGVTPDVALCVALTILVVCTWANAVGALIPIAAQKLKIDPTVVSGPMITTLVDASGLFLYLTIAKLTVHALTGH
ncbi:MAG: magnesium transporter [Polyangiales bacterium]